MRREPIHPGELVGEFRSGERFSEPVLTPAKIIVADIATITITPAIAEASEYENKRRKLDDDQRKLLRKAGVASPTDAAAAMARRLDLEAQRQGVRAELKALGVAGDDASDVIADLTCTAIRHVVCGRMPVRLKARQMLGSSVNCVWLRASCMAAPAFAICGPSSPVYEKYRTRLLRRLWPSEAPPKRSLLNCDVLCRSI
jgi:hypothetical protein